MFPYSVEYFYDLELLVHCSSDLKCTRKDKRILFSILKYTPERPTLIR